MKSLIKFVIFLYRIILAPFIGGQCRYYPSCSEYADQAIDKHNLFYAVYLILKRICRCHPFSKGGVDFVPKAQETTKHEYRNPKQYRISKFKCSKHASFEF